MKKRCGYVSIVGKPNVGKSSLLNALVGKKVSIVSDKPGTTRHRVYGVVTKGDAQALFTDTPGLFVPSREIDRFMEKMVLRAVEGVDVVVFVSDNRGPEDLDRRMLTTVKIRGGGAPVVLALNKMDKLGNTMQLARLVESWRKLHEWKAIVPICVKTRERLDLLWNEITAVLPERPWEVAEDEEVAMDDRKFVADVIREAALTKLREEVPHAVAVVIDRFEEEGNLLRVAANLVVERESQKRIVIGEKGSMIKAIGTAARLQIQDLMAKKVFLELFVKVREKWRDDPSRLVEYGYGD